MKSDGSAFGHGRVRHIITLQICAFGLATAAPADAQEAILGKQIVYTAPPARELSVRILRDGHILISMVGSECHPKGGFSGGEAKIGDSMSVSFSCKLGGTVTNYTVQSTASFENGILNIEENWTRNGVGVRHQTSIKVNGSSCSGSYMGHPITSCTVR